ncbi:MAG: hypothetical protein K0V04_12220 [Deltaproteobacteria bacterium]|nr:hypothetical protein [Deltaproteobacteria bacterium]
MRISVLFILSVALAAPLTGCKKNDKGTENPDEAAESDVDPLDELQTIPDQIQAEIDMVLQPINDVDVVIDMVTSMPQTLGLDAASLRGMAAASLSADGEVSVELDIAAEAKAEVEAALLKIKGIGTGLRETPERVKTATANIVALGAKATGLVAKLTAKYQAKLSNPMLKGDKKAKVEADLALIVKVDTDIKASVSDAKQTVTSLPSKGKEALVKLTKAFAGGASTD